MSDSVYGVPRSFNTAPVSANFTIRINTDDLRVFNSKNTTIRPGGLSFSPYGGVTGTGGAIDITGADKATIASLGPGVLSRDSIGCAERIRQDNENLNLIYRINPCNFDYRLPFPIHNVQQLQMLSFNIPSTYNISPALNNNYLTYFRPQENGTVDITTDSAVVVELPKGNYSTITSILTLINTALAIGTQGTNLSPQFRYDTVSNRVYFVDNENDTTDQSGIHGILDFRHPSINGAGQSIPRSGSLTHDSHCLGWLLGFRKMVYTGGELNGALPNMFEALHNYPNYEGDWPGGVIDSAYVPPTTTNADLVTANFTPWGYIAESNYDLNNENLYISIEDNVSNKVGGYIFSTNTTEATGLNHIIARYPLNDPENFSSTVRTYIQPYPTISKLKIKIYDEKGRQPDFGLNTVTMELQLTNIINTADPLPNGSTY